MKQLDQFTEVNKQLGFSQRNVLQLALKSQLPTVSVMVRPDLGESETNLNAWVIRNVTQCATYQANGSRAYDSSLLVLQDGLSAIADALPRQQPQKSPAVPIPAPIAAQATKTTTATPAARTEPKAAPVMVPTAKDALKKTAARKYNSKELRQWASGVKS